MAVGLAAKRRKLSEEECTVSAAEAAAAVVASLGRKVRVYRSSMASGKGGGGTCEWAGTAWTVIRVVFPDHYVLEAKFGRWEAVQKLMDLLRRAVSRPEAPFYVYTAPPKEKVLDLAADFFSAGFIPGAVVYFGCEDASSSSGASGPWPYYLREEVCSMEGIDVDSETF